MLVYTIEIEPDYLDLWTNVIYARLVEDATRLVRDLRDSGNVLAAPKAQESQTFENGRLTLGTQNRTGFSALLLPTCPSPPRPPLLRFHAVTPSPRYAHTLRLVAALARWHGGDAVRIASNSPIKPWEEAVAHVRGFFGYPVTVAFVLDKPGPTPKP